MAYFLTQQEEKKLEYFFGILKLFFGTLIDQMVIFPKNEKYKERRFCVNSTDDSD